MSRPQMVLTTTYVMLPYEIDAVLRDIETETMHRVTVADEGCERKVFWDDWACSGINAALLSDATQISNPHGSMPFLP